jgi:Flp pilus assembly protein TadG
MFVRSVSKGLRKIWRSDERGAVAVEFGISVLVMIFLMVGVLEFGRAFYHHRVVTMAVRDATRYLARVADPNDAGFVTEARNLAYTGTRDGSGAPLLMYWDPGPSPGANGLTFTVRVQAGPVRLDGDPNPGDAIVGTAIVPYTPPWSLLPLLGINGMTFTIIHEERYIGQA